MTRLVEARHWKREADKFRAEVHRDERAAAVLGFIEELVICAAAEGVKAEMETWLGSNLGQQTMGRTMRRETIERELTATLLRRFGGYLAGVTVKVHFDTVDPSLVHFKVTGVEII